MKRCPKCGHDAFYVTAHVTQEWMVDCNGYFLEVVNECDEVTHFPKDYDLWECTKCGCSNQGYYFNIK